MLHLRPLGQLSVYVIPFSFEKLFARTDGKNNKIFNFRTEQKLSIYGDFEGSILPNSQKISSRSRYDRFDSPPYISTVFCALRKCKKNRQERYEILKFDPAKTLINQGFSAEKTAKANAHFECCTFDHSDNSPYSILHFLLARIILSNILCFVNKNLRQTEKTVCRRVLIKKAFYKLRYCVYRYFIAQRVAVFFAQNFECSVIVAVAQKLRKFFI